MMGQPLATAIKPKKLGNIPHLHLHRRQLQNQRQNGAGSSSVLVNGTKSGIRNNVGAMATRRGAIRREVRY